MKEGTNSLISQYTYAFHITYSQVFLTFFSLFIFYLLYANLQFPHVWLKILSNFMALVVKGEPTEHETQQLLKNLRKNWLKHPAM